MESLFSIFKNFVANRKMKLATTHQNERNEAVML
jgi:hypothetical protein